MGDDKCSWSDCHAEAVAWIDSRAWCGRHGLRVLAGDRPTLADDVGADKGRVLGVADNAA